MVFSKGRWGQSHQDQKHQTEGVLLQRHRTFREAARKIEATSKLSTGSSGRFWTHITAWSGKVTKQTSDHQSSGGKRDRGKEREREGKVINRPSWGRVCGSDVTEGSNLSDVL